VARNEKTVLVVDDKDDIVGGYRQGAIFYLVKPFKPSYLINAVDYLIGDLSPQEQQRLETLL
jgi:DNA-binding response OmpR family regulator